jgi:ADP-ribose pyrophosphatase YjhB (NUDIX family)
MGTASLATKNIAINSWGVEPHIWPSQQPGLPDEVVQVHLFMKTGDCVLFKRSEESGSFWSPVSGAVELNERYVEAAARELEKETNIVVSPGQVILADHNMVTFSPRGRHIKLITAFTFLPPSFNQKRIKLNRELSAYLILGFEDACSLLNKRGLPEGLEGLVSIYGP